MEVLMVDLVGQYERLRNEIDPAILDTVKEGWFIGGKRVESFAHSLSSYHSVNHAIPCGNGTDALQIALMALNIGRGDEVIVPSFTYIATAEVISLLGAKPVFVDVDPNTFNIESNGLIEAISDNTKAIIVVHLFGQCGPLEEIMTISERYSIPIIEDGAQSIGCDYLFKDGRKMKSGAIGTIGCTSFFPSKNLGAYGDGGAITTNNDHLAEKIKRIANHGQVKKYHHEILGVNSRLDTIQAAILEVKLNHLDDFIERRRKAAGIYDRLLNKVDLLEIPARVSYSQHVFHQYTLKLNKSLDRDKIRKQLLDMGIPTMVYYPLPQHLQKAFLNVSKNVGNLLVSTSLPNQVLSLPMHTELKEDQQHYVCESLISILREYE